MFSSSGATAALRTPSLGQPAPLGFSGWRNGPTTGWSVKTPPINCNSYPGKWWQGPGQAPRCTGTNLSCLASALVTPSQEAARGCHIDKSYWTLPRKLWEHFKMPSLPLAPCNSSALPCWWPHRSPKPSGCLTRAEAKAFSTSKLFSCGSTTFTQCCGCTQCWNVIPEVCFGVS